MLKGFHCPYGKGDISFADCLEHSATDPPECGFVHPILAGIVNTLQVAVLGIVLVVWGSTL